MTPAELESYSVVAVYSAIVVYAIAFIVFVMGLSARAALAQPAEARQLVAAGGEPVSAPAAPVPVVVPGVRWERTGLALTVIAWLVHVGAVVLRGLAAGRVPWSNFYEFALTGTAIMVTVFLGVQLWRNLRFLGSYVTGLITLFLALVSLNTYIAVTPLPPALQSVWLVVHVFVAILGTGFFMVGGGVSVVQVLQARREAGKPSPALLRTLPDSETLERIASRLNIVGFAFWTFTLIAGAIWAHFAWGRYWGWDTKEVWTFIIWVVYAGYIHARATQGWRGTRSAVLSLIGFGAVLFNFTIVNLVFQGLHSYSGL